MRIVAWNCSMALHRKAEALLCLKPDIAIVSECAQPDIMCSRATVNWLEAEPIWIGNNPNKGLGVFTFNGYAAALNDTFHHTLRYIAPVRITGPVNFNLLAVWAQNASGGNIRKHQAGPLRRALTKYRDFLSDADTVVAGDLNNNIQWDRPGWRINHQTVVDRLYGHGIVSAYHAITGEAQGHETIPTHYWRDRKKDGPTYHLDYIFLPQPWLGNVSRYNVGTFEDWCGSGLSDHVAMVVDVDLSTAP